MPKLSDLFTQNNINNSEPPISSTGKKLSDGFQPIPENQQGPEFTRDNNVHDIDVSKYSDYLTGGVFDNQYLDEARARKQSSGEKWLHGLGKAGSTAITSMGEGLGILGGGIAAIATQDSDTVFKNPVVEFFSSIQEDVNEALPNYYTIEEQNNNVLQNLATANFWSDKFMSGVGFAASSFIPAIGIAKLGSGLKAAMSIAKGTKAAMVVDGMTNLTGAVIGRIGESGIEANGAYDEIYNNLIKQGATPERADALAKDARLKVFGTNMMLAIPDAIQFGILFNGFRNTATKAATSGFGKKLLLTIPTEAAEENLQLAITNTARKLANQEYSADAKENTQNYFESIFSEFGRNFTTKEGQESMLLGGLVGAGMLGLSKVNDSLAKLSPTVSNQDVIAKIKRNVIIAQTELEGIKNKAAAKGDIGKYNHAKNTQFNSFIKGAIDANEFQGVIDEFEAMKKMSPEEMEKEYGISLLETDAFNLPKTPDKIAEKFIKQAREAQKQHEDINLNYPDASKLTKDELFLNTLDQKYVSSKITVLSREISKEDSNRIQAESRGEAYVEPVTITKMRDELEQLKAGKVALIERYKVLIDPKDISTKKKEEEIANTPVDPVKVEKQEATEAKNKASEFVVSNKDVSTIAELDKKLNALDPAVKAEVIKNHKSMIANIIANDSTLPVHEDNMIVGAEIPAQHKGLFGTHTHINLETNTPYTPKNITPTEVISKPESKELEKVPFNAIPRVEATGKEKPVIHTRNTEFVYRIEKINDLEYIIPILDIEGLAPTENQFDKNIYKIDFDLIATPEALAMGTIATLEILDTKNVEFKNNHKHGKDSIIIKVDGIVVGKLAESEHFETVKAAIISNNGKVEVKLNGKWGSSAIRTTKTTTSINDIKTLSERNLPNGQIIIGTIKDDTLVFPDSTRREDKDFDIKNKTKMNGDHFLVLKTPEGNLYPDVLYNTPAKDITINGKSLATIVMNKMREFRKVLDAVAPEQRQEELKAIKEKWNSFRSANIDPILNYNTDGYNLRINIDKTTGKFVYVLDKGNKKFLTGKDIVEDITNRFFNISAKLLKENKSFTFEGQEYPTYVDFLVANNIVTTSLYANRPFSFTEIEVDISNILSPISKEENSKEHFEVTKPEEAKPAPVGDDAKSKAREKLRKSKEGGKPTLFREVADKIYKQWNKEKELTWMVNNLPQIPVDVLESTKTIFEKYGVEAHGVFTNAIVTLANNAEVGTTYHEAFHAVFNLYLTEEQKTKVLNDNRKDNETDLQVEERIAESFRDYVLTQGEVKPKNNILSKLFSDVLLWIKNKIGLLQLNDLYQMIHTGKFANLPIINNENDIIKTRSITGFNEVEKRTRLNVFTKQLFDELVDLQNSGNIVSIDFSKVTNSQIDQAFENIKVIWEVASEDAKSEEERTKINKVLEAFDEFKTLTIKELSKYGLDKAEEVKERIFEQAAFETSQKDNVGKEVKLYLATVPNVESEKDDLGFTTFVDFHDIYNYLAGNLTGLENIEEMIEELEFLSVLRPDLNNIIEDLKKTPSQNSSEVTAETFRHKFFHTFSNQYIDFLTLARSSREVQNGPEKETQYFYNTYETNKRSLQRQIVSDWATNYKELKRKGNLLVNKNKYIEFRTLIDKTFKKQLNTVDNYEGLDQISKLLSEIGIEISEKGLIAMKQWFVKNNPNEDFTDYIGRTNAPTIAQILRKHHDGEDIYTGLDESKGERKAINELAQFEKLVRVDKANASFLNGQNKTVYAINTNHYASKLVNRLKTNKDGIVDKFLSIPYFKNCKILKDIKENTDEFKMFVFDTLFNNDDSREGVAYDELDPLQAIAVRLNMFNNRNSKYGYFHSPTPADRGNIQVFKLPKLSEKNETIFNTDDTLNKDSEFYKWIVGSIQDEYDRIVQTNVEQGMFSPIKNYHFVKEDKGNAYFFNQYWEFNKFLGLDEHYANNREVLPDLDTTSDKFYQYLSKSLSKQFKTEKIKLSETGIVNYDSNKNILKGRDVTPSLIHHGIAIDHITIDNYISNYMYAYTDLTKILGGDLAFYKSGDEQIADANKRFGQSVVPGKDNSSSTEKYQGGSRPTFNLAIASDNEVASDYIIDYARAIYDSLDTNEKVDFATLFDKKRKDFNNTEIFLRSLLAPDSKGYLKNNQTDAQGYITLDRLRNIMEGQGAFTAKYKTAWERLNEGGSNFEDITTVFQPIKGFYYNQEFKDNLAVPTQVKYSTVPLIPAFVNKYPKLKTLLDKMVASQVDEFVFESGVKVGIKNKNDNNILDNNSPLTFITLSNSNWRVPQVVPYKEKTKENFGSQIRKLITGNIDNTARYIVDKAEMTGGDLKSLYQSLISANIEEGYNNLIPKFSDKKEVAKMIQEELESSSRRSLPDLYEKALQYINGDTRVSLDFPLIKRKIENILLSMFEKKVVKQEMPGFAAVQISSFGVANTSEDLKFVREDKETGKILPAEILVSPQYFLNLLKQKKIDTTNFDINNISEELLNVVIYRIPTQGKNSMLSCRIKGFLPAEAGSQIICPFEITTQSGSDFDIDKVYIEMYNTKVINGKFQKLESGTESKKARQNAILDIHYSILTDTKHFAEVITPNHSNTLKEIKNILEAGEKKIGKFWHNLWVQEELRARNQAGKQLVGVWAIQSTAHAIARDLDMKVSEPVLFEGRDDATTLSAIKNFFGGLISDDLSERATAAVDNAKDPILGYLNDNKFTCGFSSLLIRTGFGNEIPSYMVTQDVIKFLTTEYFKVASTMGDAKAYKQAIALTEKEFGITVEKDARKINPVNISLEYLKKKDKDAIFNQNILESFIKYKEIGDALSRVSNALAIDTKGVEATIPENISNLNNLKDAKQNNYITFDRTRYNNHSLSNYEQFGIEGATEAIKQYMPLDSSVLMLGTEEGETIGENYKGILERFEDIKGDRLSPDEIQKITYDFYTYLHTHPDSNYSKISNSYKLQLFTGEGRVDKLSLGERLKKYAKEKGKNLNPFIGNLKSERDETTGFDLIKYNNTAALSSEEKTDLSNSIYDLINGIEEEARLAKDLAIYSFITYGFNRSVDTYIDLLPIEIFEQYGLTEFYRNIKYFFDSPILSGEDIFNTNNFIDQYIQNNALELSFIPKLSDKAIKKLIDGNDEDLPMYIYSKKSKNILKFDGFESYNRITKLGLSKSIKEYNMMDGNLRSIIPNNFSKKQVKSVNSKLSVAHLVNILDNLSKRFGIEYVISDEDSNYAGEFKDGKVIIYSKNVGLDTPFHEFAHPFVELIKKQNPILYKNLEKQIRETTKGIEILAKVEQDYSELSPAEQMEEAIVQAIGEFAANKVSATQDKGLWSAIKRFFERLASYLGMDSIDANSTLEDIGEFIATGEQSIDLSEMNESKTQINPVANTLYRAFRSKYASKGRINPNLVIDAMNERSRINRQLGFEAIHVFKDPQGIWRMRLAGSSKYQKVDKLGSTIDSIREILNRQVAIYSNRGDNTNKHAVDKLKSLLEKITTLNDIEGVYLFIEEARDYTEKAGNRLNEVISGKITGRDAIKALVEINEYAHSYDVLDQVENLEVFKLRNNPTGDIVAKLTEAIKRRNEIKRDYFELGIPLFADFLLSYNTGSVDNAAELNAPELKITRYKMIAELREASKDVSKDSAMLDPIISSKDASLALFAKALKRQLEEARQKDINFENEAGEALKKYIESTGKSTLDVSKFYSDIYETIEEFTGGKWTKKYAFVQKYDVTSYNKNKKALYDRLGKRPERESELKKWKREVAKWYSQNTTILEDGTQVPSLKYTNQKWIVLQKNAPALEFYNFLYSSYIEAQNKLPEAHRLGYVIPSDRKDTTDRLVEQGLISTSKSVWKEATQFQTTDKQEFGIQSQSGNEYKSIPIFYTQAIDIEDVSLDLLGSVMKFTSMTNRFQSLSEIHHEVNMMKDIIGNRTVRKTNGKGEGYLDAATKKLGIDSYIKKNGESNAYYQLAEFINRVVYNEKQIQEELFGINVTKVANSLMGITATNALAGNLMNAISNVTMGNLMNFSEAAGGQWYGKEDWIKGNGDYWSNINNVVGDFGKLTDKSLQTQLIDHFDAIQGEFTDTFGNKVTSSNAKRLFSTNSLFFMQHIGEHQIQISTMNALMRATKVQTKEGNKISLKDAYELDSKGRLVLKEGVIFTDIQKELFQNRLHGINKRLQGVYNTFDKAAIQSTTLGRLGMLFRNWVRPGIIRRYGLMKVDYELDDVVEGNYITFFKAIKNNLSDLAKFVTFQDNNLTELQKQNIRRTLVEINAMLGAAILFGLLAGGDDDEEKNSWGENFLAYQSRRLQAELMFYTNPGDFFRVLKTPTATMNQIEKTSRFIDQCLFTWNPEKLEYQRKSGIHEKGDNKSVAYLEKLIPILGQIQTVRSPEEAIKFFK